MKTCENISYFRSSIIEKIEEMMENSMVMERAVKGFMEIEEEEDNDKAYDIIVSELLDVKSMFYRLDDIIDDIDIKHMRYMKNAVARARFKLATGNNMEGKLAKILDLLAEEINNDEDNVETVSEELYELCNIYSQGYISPESFRAIPITKKNVIVDNISEGQLMSDDERMLYKEALKQKNRLRFSRKNINEYVGTLLDGREKMSVEEITVESKRDLIRIIYISIYAGNRANNYEVKRTGKRIKKMGYEFPLFEIIKR